MLLTLTSNIYSQSVKKIVIDEKESVSSYYLAVEPETDSIAGVLIMLAGFGQRAESVFPDTKLHNVTYVNSILTIGFSVGNKLYVDSITQYNLTAVIKHVLSKYKVSPQKFVLSGFSSGGTIALRYVELCNQFPGKFPIQPKGVFMVDSPIDIFTVYDLLEQISKDNYPNNLGEEWVLKIVRNDHGVPRENIPGYSKLTAFSMNKKYGENEIYLKNTAVRAYHDVDISWKIVHDNQTVRNANFEVTAELIARLIRMGNKKAEFIQSFDTGYRSIGQKNPHCWSIVDEVECIQWMKDLINN